MKRSASKTAVKAARLLAELGHRRAVLGRELLEAREVVEADHLAVAVAHVADLDEVRPREQRGAAVHAELDEVAGQALHQAEELVVGEEALQEDAPRVELEVAPDVAPRDPVALEVRLDHRLDRVVGGEVLAPVEQALGLGGHGHPVSCTGLVRVNAVRVRSK
jgi:hypothetical protein